MSAPKHAFQKADWIVGSAAALISFIVYAWSAAPNVTLLDSGEFIVAAQHFGVPHPTGYPIWTILNWLFLLLPLGNAAWEVAIFSGLCASLAVGLCASLLSNIQWWCLEGKLPGHLKWIPSIIAIAFSLMLAFSQSMWSQAVIAEVYALHALIVAMFLMVCYAWVRNPANDRLMFGAFFLLALAFSNHQLILALSILPYLLILLLRRRRFMDWLFAGLLTLLLGYLVFAILSGEQMVLKTAIRLFYCVAGLFGLFLWKRRLRIQWKLIAFLPLAVAAGLLPYAYMPFASSTNPPMNWGYARELDGFFFSINRSQYNDSMSDTTVKTLGRLMGTSNKRSAAQKPAAQPEVGRLQTAQLWVGFFWQKLAAAFTPVALIGYFASIILVLRLPLPKRTWVYFLHIAFVLAAFLQPLMAGTKISNSDWWTQMPYHTYTNLIYALLSGLGLALLTEKIAERRPAVFWLVPALLILPILTFRGSEASCNQRDHWFGWMFGHDMLKDLPQGSVVIGGTDPGRFVPTYMIFGESAQPPGDKRDPNFDRRDLYIITQNALGESNYMKYLRDHYTSERPAPKNAFERWLGRDKIYPEKPILLPSQQEINDLLKRSAEEQKNSGQPNDENPETMVFSRVLKWIWEKNRDNHDFFIEESFPIKWTYEYAIPHGLIYRLNKTPLKELPQEAIDRDFAFWSAYKSRLLANPAYKHDFDAQRSFSKLRMSLANVYRHRKMDIEAERAYREALELWPENLEAILALTPYLWERGEFDEVLDFIKGPSEKDPNDISVWRLQFMAERRKELGGEISALSEQLNRQPKSGKTLRDLVSLYDQVGETNKAYVLIDKAVAEMPSDTDLLRFFIEYYARRAPEKMLKPAQVLVSVEDSNAENHYLLAIAWFVQENMPEFYKSAKRAVQLGGAPMRKLIKDNPMFEEQEGEPEFKKLINPSFIETP
jgi:tetratricopeptide (TPR) repeat protein